MGATDGINAFFKPLSTYCEIKTVKFLFGFAVFV